MKKKISMVMAVMLAGAMLLSSCAQGTTGNSSSSKASTSPSNAAGPEKYSLPLVTDGSVTLSVATYENPLKGTSYTSNLEVWKKFEQDTGVKIDWQVSPSSDYDTIIQTRLAAGTGLPDFVRIPSNPMKYVNDGIIVPITEQLEKNGYYTNKFYEENPYVKPFVTAPDGQVYYFTSDVAGAAVADPYVYMIRQDWLDKCNLKAPETLDDWYKTWKAFLDNDVNGNGQRDEIPFCNDNKLIGVTIFGNAFGLKLHRSSGWNVNNAGKVEYDYIKPEMKELLTWLNKCYTENLLDKEFATQGFDVIMKKVSSNQAGSVFRALNGLNTFNKAISDAKIDGKYTVVAPPKKSADSSIPQYVERYGPVSGMFGFTKDCKDLDVKVKFIDYVTASEAGNYGECFGIENKSYKMENGKPAYTDYVTKNPDGKAMNDVLNGLGCSPTLPWYRSLNGYWSYQPMQSIAHLQDTYNAAKMYEKYNVDNFPQGTLMTDDEQTIVNQYQTDIDTYRDEMITKFIMGTESLNNFDAYVKNIQAMNLDRVLQVRQTQYDRYVNTK